MGSNPVAVTSKYSYINSKENNHSTDNFSRENLNESSHYIISTPTSRFSNKPKEIQTRTKHKNEVLGGGNQYCGDGCVPPKGKITYITKDTNK